ncbi:hypothetical protein SEUCBS139899_003695 [Sporothrix eucalyptigena]|uniref:t-SNARE coiled-coil homology domain-containing protein n=1 Tax=Sporothrix eucalyptigena TaxID=1812306 RepID=A0ABP0BQI6_9PEZI
MASPNDEDPFLQVQQDVLAQLASTRPLFESYLRIRSLSTSSTSPELTAARADLENAITALSEDLADLTESVRAVQHNPTQFGLSQAEVTRRQRVVDDAGREVQRIQKELKAPMGGAGGTGGDLPDPNSFAMDDGHDNYAEFEREQQLQMMNEQDRHLDDVSQTVGNLRRQADDMGRELEEQREMLEVTDNLADRVEGRLQTGMQKLQYVIRNNEDRWSSCCIGVLIVVLIILLVLLLVL